uniref:Uncharacterized protein n=1 Tax=Thermogemmatispora argillosa TaxID=2045280 RepID=A0A455T8T9_9CHLR|nr:hypothetical protein KTA_39740 [Thermogemmatispora argillosa]
MRSLGERRWTRSKMAYPAWSTVAWPGEEEKVRGERGVLKAKALAPDFARHARHQLQLTALIFERKAIPFNG